VKNLGWWREFLPMENYGIQLKIVNSCALARKIGHVASWLAVQIVLGWRLFDDTHHVLEEALLYMVVTFGIGELWIIHILIYSICIPVWPHVCWILSLVYPI
jgi:hypothetical protein